MTDKRNQGIYYISSTATGSALSKWPNLNPVYHHQWQS